MKSLSRRAWIQRSTVLGVGLVGGDALLSDAAAQQGSGVGKGAGGAGQGGGPGGGQGRGASSSTGRGMGPGGAAGSGAMGRPAPVPLEGETWGLNGAKSFGEYKGALVQAGKQVPPVSISPSNPSILFHEYLCGHCGHCDEACLMQGVAHRFDPAKLKDATVHPCIHCGQCTNQCKRGGMTERIEYPRIRRQAEDATQILIASTSPAVRVALGECFGYDAGGDFEGKMISALRAIGFKYVLDTTFAADLTIMEEASELVRRLESKSDGSKLPMFTSCCPGWVSFAEQFYPQLLPNLSSTKSPVMMQGAVVKTWFAKRMNLDVSKIVHVAITPCTAKKYEAQRPEMNAAGRYLGDESLRDVDAALTCRETGQWIYESRVRFDDLPNGQFDSLMGHGSGGGVIFGNTGGVMESALRTAWQMMTGEQPPRKLLAFEAVRGLSGVKEATVDMDGQPVRVAVVSGVGNARPFLDAVLKGEKTYDFVEVMACSGGCVGGGGQPKPNGNGRPNDALRQQRIDGLYAKESQTVKRCSFENPEVREFYADFAEKPLSETSAKLLHTSYTDRNPFA